MKLIYHPEAEREFTEAAQYYEGRLDALGIRFLDDADRSLEAIVENPKRWMISEDDIRVCLMPRFPYAIYYRLLSDRIHS